MPRTPSLQSLHGTGAPCPGYATGFVCPARSQRLSWSPHGQHTDLRAAGRGGGPSWISSEDERAQGGQPGPRPRSSYAVGRGPTPDPEAARFLTTEAEPGPAPCRGLLCYPCGARGPCCWGRWRSRGAPRTRVPSPCRGAALCCPDLANGCGPKRQGLSPSLASRLVPLHFACGRGRGGAGGDPGLPLGPSGGGRVLWTGPRPPSPHAGAVTPVTVFGDEP